MNELKRTPRAAVTAPEPKFPKLQTEAQSSSKHPSKQTSPLDIPRPVRIPLIVNPNLSSRKPKILKKEYSLQNLPPAKAPGNLRRIPIHGLVGSAIVQRPSFSTEEWEKDAAISICEVDLSKFSSSPPKGAVETPKKSELSPRENLTSKVDKERKSLFKKTRGAIPLKGLQNPIEKSVMEDSEQLVFDFTALPYVKKKKKHEFNKIVKDYLEAALKKHQFRRLTKERINELGYAFLKEEVNNASLKGADSPVGEFLTKELSERTSEIFDLLQKNGILWAPITDRLIFIRSKLDEVLALQERRSRWVNTLYDLLNFLINLPKTKEQPIDGFVTPLRYLIDRLHKGIEDKVIRRIVLTAIGKLDYKNVIKTLRKWSNRGFFDTLPKQNIDEMRMQNLKISKAIHVEHKWYESEDSDAAIDDIKHDQVINSYSRGNVFLPRKFMINDSLVDITGKLFSNPAFCEEIYKRIQEFNFDSSEDSENSKLNLIKELLEMEDPIAFPSKYFHENLEERGLFINWLKVILSSELKDVFALKRPLKGDPFFMKFKLLMQFLEIPNNRLLVGKRKKIIEDFVKVFVKQHCKQDVDIGDVVAANKRYILQLHTFLRNHLTKFLPEKVFNQFLFTELCKEIYGSGFDSRVGKEDIPKIVEKLLAHQESDDMMHRLWTLLRFGTGSAFSKPIQLSWVLVPDLFRCPYYTRAPVEGGLKLIFQIDSEAFKVIQVRPYAFYTKKHSDSLDSTEVLEDKCWATIKYKWTMSESLPLEIDSEETEKEKEPKKEDYNINKILREGILQFSKVTIHKNTPKDIQDYIWNALANYEKVKETDLIVINHSIRTPRGAPEKEKLGRKNTH